MENHLLAASVVCGASMSLTRLLVVHGNWFGELNVDPMTFSLWLMDDPIWMATRVNQQLCEGHCWSTAADSMKLLLLLLLDGWETPDARGEERRESPLSRQSLSTAYRLMFAMTSTALVVITGIMQHTSRSS